MTPELRSEAGRRQCICRRNLRDPSLDIAMANREQPALEAVVREVRLPAYLAEPGGAGVPSLFLRRRRPSSANAPAASGRLPGNGTGAGSGVYRRLLVNSRPPWK